MDTSNFDPIFTEVVPQDSLPNQSILSDTLQQHFEGFTYTEEQLASMASSRLQKNEHMQE
jgi:serum/glucocorticoid-regulated kinase 2